MTTGQLLASPIFPIAVLISAVGAFFACWRWSSRLWFFMVAPPLYGLLWHVIGAAVVLPLMLVELLTGISMSGTPHYWVTNGGTLILYALNCIMMRRDGRRGLRMMGYGSMAPRCFDARNTSLPDSVTQRRMRLH